jgi:hypothetical protein
MTIKPCNTCIFFRSLRPLSQLLARDLGIGDQAVVQLLTQIMHEEQERQDAEAKERLELKNADREEYSFKPRMSDYCGLHESESEAIYLVHQIKNAGGEMCDDHKPQTGKEDVQACSTCQHRVDGEGNLKDQRMIARYGELARGAAALGQGSNDHGLRDYVQKIGTVKAFEAAQASYSGRISCNKPEYLPVCSKFSQGVGFVPCAVQNPHDHCKEWSPLTESPPSGTSESEKLVNSLLKLSERH